MFGQKDRSQMLNMLMADLTLIYIYIYIKTRKQKKKKKMDRSCNPTKKREN